MIKKVAIYLLLVSSSVCCAQEPSVGLGRGLSDAINATIVDEPTQDLFSEIIDLYLDKVDFTQEQWIAMRDLLSEGLGILDRKMDETLIEVQKEYAQEVQEILSAVLDKDGNLNDEADSQAFLQEALGELEKDERFAAMHACAQEEQEFKNKVAVSLLADLSNAGTEDQDKKISVEEQLVQLKNMLQRVVKSVENKVAE